MAHTNSETELDPAERLGAVPHRWTFITVTYNSASKLERYWSGVSLGPDTDWVVVDNGSEDDSCAVARSLGARVISLPRNRGFGAANNVGFRRSSSPFVCFVNPDVTPIPGDLPVLESVIEGDPRRLVAPQLVNDDGTLQPNGRGEPRLWTKVMHRVAPERVACTYHRQAQPGELVSAVWLTGAVVAGRRDWLQRLGPWDERFFVYYEDIDLGLRNASASGDSLIVGDAKWIHGWARETASLNWRAWRRELGSMLKFYARYPALIAG